MSKAVEIGDGSWRLSAACRGASPSLWYAERGEPTKEAKTVCASCPVREPCLEYALVNGERFGLWGGRSERERRRMRPRSRVQSGTYTRNVVKCPACGDPFITSNQRQRCCSRSCARILQHRENPAFANLRSTRRSEAS